MQNIPHIINVTAAVLMTVLPPAFWDDIKTARTEALKGFAAAQVQAKAMVETGDFSALDDLPLALSRHQKQFEAVMPLAEMLVQKGYFDDIPVIK